MQKMETIVAWYITERGATLVSSIFDMSITNTSGFKGDTMDHKSTVEKISVQPVW